MRNLQECQAEVFRRSKNRIKEKKRHRMYALVACVPAALCIVVLSVFFFPKMKPTDINGESATTNPVYEMFATTVRSDVTVERFSDSVNVSGNGISLSHTSEETVQGIIQLLDHIVSGDEKNNDETVGDFATGENASTDTSASVKEYKILIQRGDGTSTEYLLTDSALMEKATLEKFYIDEDVCLALKNALGIPVD